MLHTAWLSLGSNIQPARNLPKCVQRLSAAGRVLAVSAAWCSPSAGDSTQPDYLNAAVQLSTALSAEEILNRLIPDAEQALGRVRDPRNINAARTIDVDLSLYDRMTGMVGRHQLPDPDILTRAFVAVPLAELDAEYVHPVDGRTLGEIAAALRKAAGTELSRASLALWPDTRATPEG
ncbi:MAG: 2-amino-4-hydroxy-6-hydroxymethyldihydropteridine diphosphokinase [Planctomycetaceae bacterium]|nr:2-amino-4-hydroxy-6-hydroxymethyldihydropteridine diphosphokinase [Planctomycetaceae bacterium]